MRLAFSPQSKNNAGPEKKPNVVWTLTPGAGNRLTAPLTLTLQQPTLQVLGYHANRLLKTKYPFFVGQALYPRLFQASIQSQSNPPLKNWHEQLPPPTLDSLHLQLWQAALGLPKPQALPMNDLLHLWLGFEASLQFNPMGYFRVDQEKMTQHAQALGAHPYQTSRAQSVLDDKIYESISSQVLQNWLDVLNLEPVCLEAMPTELTQWEKYSLARWLGNPLPWASLLDEIEAESAKGFDWMGFCPWLGRLQGVYKFLQQMPLPESLQTLDLKEMTKEETPKAMDFIWQWLHQISQMQACKALNKPFDLSVPLKAMVLVEGVTEAVLLPAFLEAFGVNLQLLGLQVECVGGKSHMLSRYKHHRQNLKGPLLLLLDADAAELAPALNPLLESDDELIVIKNGEFEDLYTEAHMVEAINTSFSPYPVLKNTNWTACLNPEEPETPLTVFKSRVEMLKAFWRKQGWGEFDKTAFAHKLKLALESKKQPLEVYLSPEMLLLLEKIKTLPLKTPSLKA